jgi:hypothetical protein
VTTTPAASPALQCAVTLGFAGSRQLLDQAPADGTELVQIQKFLTDQLKGLPDALRLSNAHFLCGLSQIAIGGTCCSRERVEISTFRSGSSCRSSATNS